MHHSHLMSLTTSTIKSANGSSKYWMVVLHGLGDSMEGYQWMPEKMALPWMNYLLVNAPEAYYTGYSWFDIEGNHDPGVQASRTQLFTTLDQFREEQEVDSKCLFVFGFSQGCVMTVETGFRYPHSLAGCIGVSGFIHRLESLFLEASPHAKEQHFLLTHGSYDPLIPAQPVGDQVEQMKQKGFACEWQIYPKEHTIYGDVEIQCFRDFLERRKEAIETSQN